MKNKTLAKSKIRILAVLFLLKVFSLMCPWLIEISVASKGAEGGIEGFGPGMSITSLGTAMTQNFDGLSAVVSATPAWTDDVTLPGWHAQVNATASPSTYRVDHGSSNTGSIFSYGSAGSSDRALGSVASSGNTYYHALKLSNATGVTISAASITYVGEQWRNGGNAASQKLDFQYRVADAGVVTDANTPATAGTDGVSGWTDLDALDFTSPVVSPSAVPTPSSALDGNASSNRSLRSSEIGLTWKSGQELWIRWKDVDDVGGDHGLAVDDLSIKAYSVPETSISSTVRAYTGSTAAFTFTSDNAGSTFECGLDSESYDACSPDAVFTDLKEGLHVLNVRARTPAGVDATPATFIWSVDLTAPSLTLGSPISNTFSTEGRSFGVSAADAMHLSSVSLTYRVAAPSAQPSQNLEDAFGVPVTVDCAAAGLAGQFECVIPGQALGSAVAYSVTATDGAGNSSVSPSWAAPNIYAVGTATVPAGIYSDIQMDGNVTLAGPVMVTGRMTVTGIVSTGDKLITLAPDAIVSGSGPTDYIVGRLAKQFSGPGTFTFPVGSAPLESADVSAYAPVDVRVSQAVGVSSLTVGTTAAPLPGAAAGASLSRYWSIAESGDVTADLTFHYLDRDVIGAESSYRVIKRSGAAVSQVEGGTVDESGNTFFASGVSMFSDWSAGAIGTTAASADVEGKISDPQGSPLKNVTVMIAGGDLREAVFTKTNQFGGYRFHGLAAGETYVIQVMSGRYVFRNPSKVIGLYESLSREDFVGEPAGSRR